MPNVFDSSSAAVGSIQASLLTEAEFQSIFGTGWVLARGQSVSGSKYTSLTGVSSVPDLRGQFLRGKNNGRSDGNQDPGGERNLRDGVIQQDQYQGHTHSTGSTISGAGGGLVYLQPPGLSNNQVSGYVTKGNFADEVGNGTPRTGNETRPRNVTVNYFIRIN